MPTNQIFRVWHMEDGTTLTATDIAVLGILADKVGTVVSRDTIRRLADLRQFSERRCDSAIVAIRKAINNDSVVTVRGRGWMLRTDYVDVARTLIDAHFQCT